MSTGALALSSLLVLLSALVIPAWRDKHRACSHTTAVQVLSVLALIAAVGATVWIILQVISVGVYHASTPSHSRGTLSSSVLGIPVIVIPLLLIGVAVGAAELLFRTVLDRSRPPLPVVPRPVPIVPLPIELRPESERTQSPYELAHALIGRFRGGRNGTSEDRPPIARPRRRADRMVEALRAELDAGEAHSSAFVSDAISQIDSRWAALVEEGAQARASTETAVEGLEESVATSALGMQPALDHVSEMCALVVDRVEAYQLERPQLAAALAKLARVGSGRSGIPREIRLPAEISLVEDLERSEPFVEDDIEVFVEDDIEVFVDDDIEVFVDDDIEVFVDDESVVAWHDVESTMIGESGFEPPFVAFTERTDDASSDDLYEMLAVGADVLGSDDFADDDESEPVMAGALERGPREEERPLDVVDPVAVEAVAEPERPTEVAPEHDFEAASELEWAATPVVDVAFEHDLEKAEEPQFEVAALPEVEAATEPEGEAAAVFAHEAAYEVAPELEVSAEPVAHVVDPAPLELAPEPDVDVVELAVAVEPQPEPVVEVAEPEPVVEVVSEPEPVIEVASEPEPVIEVVSEPEPVVEVEPEPEPVVEVAEPVVEVASESDAEVAPELEDEEEITADAAASYVEIEPQRAAQSVPQVEERVDRAEPQRRTESAPAAPAYGAWRPAGIEPSRVFASVKRLRERAQVATQQVRRPPKPVSDPAIEALRMRFAQGEIGYEEYATRAAQLAAPPMPPGPPAPE